MDRRPLVAIACCWVIGASILSLFQGWDAVIAVIALLLLLIGVGLTGKMSPRILLLCGLALLLASGERLEVEKGNVSDLTIAEAPVGTEAKLTGYIVSIVEVDGDLATFRLRANTLKASSGSELTMRDTVIIRIKLKQQSEQQIAANWKRGAAARVTGGLELPGDAGNFGAFDYRNYLQQQGIYWQLTVKGTDSVTILSAKTPWSMKPLRMLDDLRSAIGGLMDQLFPDGDSGYMKGLVVGIRSDLDPEQFNNFAKLGLTHVLAISGLHVGVVIFLLLQIGAWLRLTRERSLDMTIAMMPVYMMVTGASPSVVRACLMAMLALWLARRHALKDGLHLISASAVVMLVWNPLLIEDVSFQLSFIVTLGLLLFVPTVTESIPIPWRWLRGALAVAVTAQVVSFPLTVYYFHAVHLLSLPTNLILVPFISFIVMPLGMAAIAMGALWLPAGVLPARMATLGNQLTFRIVDWLSDFTSLRTVWPQCSWLWVVVAYLLMGLVIVLLKKRLAHQREKEWWSRHLIIGSSGDSGETLTAPLVEEQTYSYGGNRKWVSYKLGFAILVLVWFLWGYQPAFMDHSATISFINVGQGDCILIRTGAGKHILIDTGGTVSFRKPGEEWRDRRDPYEVGLKLLVPLLLKRGIRELDALVLTHLDADHIGGAQAIIGNIPVRSILFNGTLKHSPVADRLFQLALGKGIPCYPVHTPMEWNVDQSTRLSALYPIEEQTSPGGAIEIEDNQNEISIVLLLTVYGRHFLLPGDLEAEGEAAIVMAEHGKENHSNSRSSSLVDIDVLKAGHHGSKTSTTQTWLDYWNPSETVISVGRNNSYGHPHPTVLERLKASDSRIFRTDRDGEVQYRILADGTMLRRTQHKTL
jgi:competence protein ComEC